MTRNTLGDLNNYLFVQKLIKQMTTIRIENLIRKRSKRETSKSDD